MRLLFSSAQIEYMRYWLHATRHTAEPIPIPSSEYLIRPGDLRNVSPDVYNDANILKRAIKVRLRDRPRTRKSRPRRNRRGRRGGSQNHPLLAYVVCVSACVGECCGTDCKVHVTQNIEKNSKRLKGASTLLGARRMVFERVRTLWAAKLGTWLAIDFEAWDRDHTLLTEFGWSLVQRQDESQTKDHGHLIVRERRMYTQTYVPNNKDVRAMNIYLRIAGDVHWLLALQLRKKHRREQARV